MSDREALRRAAEQLASAARPIREGVAARAEQVASRLERGRFHVVVLGEFKRGKSTLLDALVGQAVVPSGAVPVTAVTTEVCYGPPGLTVTYLDGRTESTPDLRHVARYVTEEHNPGNQLRVDRVEVRVESSLLHGGLVLVDTPGVNSIHGHGDATAHSALLEADGAIVVLSVDAPLSEHERSMVALLHERQIRTFYVINKTDHVDPSDLLQVRRFVCEALSEQLGSKPTLFCLAALPALRAKMLGHDPGAASGEFSSFETQLRRFSEQDLAAAQIHAARKELERLAGELRTVMQVASAALAVSEETLAERVASFRAAAHAEREALGDERVLLERDVVVLARRLETNLAGFARHAPQEWLPDLREVAATTPIAQLEDRIHEEIERAVRSGFESFRNDEADFADEMWRDIAGRMRKRVEERINALREAASDLFAVRLPQIQLPAVTDERDRFFYLFLHVGSSTDTFSRMGRRFLPASIVRRRLLDRGQRQLAEEFDKHAGRARWDLTQRLDNVRRRFQAEMDQELESTIETILGAAARADELRRLTSTERESQRLSDVEASKAVEAALTLCADGSPAL